MDNGYDVKWIPDYDCEIFDEKLLDMANAEKRILITNDKDFGEIVFLQRKLSTGIILFRVRGKKADDKVRLVKTLLQKYSNKLLKHFVVITKDKIRFASLEDIK